MQQQSAKRSRRAVQSDGRVPPVAEGSPRYGRYLDQVLRARGLRGRRVISREEFKDLLDRARREFVGSIS